MANTYYVSVADGDDGNTGLSQTPGASGPWKTLGKVNGSTFSAGDSILLKCGEQWREGLTPPSAGSAGLPVTFGSYSTGAAPIIDGSDLIAPGSSWTLFSGSIWTASVTTEPKVVFFDGVKGTKVASQAACTAPRNWFWSANVLSVYSATDPDTAYTAPGIEVGSRNTPLWLDAKNYVTCDGLHFRRGNGGGQHQLHISSTHATIQSCEIDNGAQGGILVVSPSADTLITDCDIHDNAEDGIFDYHASGSSGHENIARGNRIYNNHNVSVSAFHAGIYVQANYWIIESNTVYDNGNTDDMANGIEIWDIDNIGYGQHCTVRYNRVSGQKSGLNDGTGICLDDYSSTNLVHTNICYGNDGPGLGVWRANGATLYNNTCYGNSLDSSGTHTTFAEISIAADADGMNDNVVIKNNVCQAVGTGRYAILLDSHAYKASGLSITNNVWYAEATNWYFWNASGGNVLATWNAFTGVGTDLNADPLFLDPVAALFHLQLTSPCIDAGVDVGLTQDFAGSPIPKAGPNLVPTSTWTTAAQTGWTADEEAMIRTNVRVIVQAAYISTSGNKIRLTFQAAAAATLYIDGCAIGEQDGSTPSSFAAAPTRVTFGGANTGSCAGGSTLVSDWITFNIDETKTYLVSIFLLDGGGGAHDTVRKRWWNVTPMVYQGAGTGTTDTSQSTTMTDLEGTRQSIHGFQKIEIGVLGAAIVDIGAYEACQVALPASDVSAGDWTPSTGATLFGTLDDSPAIDDTDYDLSDATPVNDTMEVALDALEEPGDGDVQIVVRHRLH